MKNYTRLASFVVLSLVALLLAPSAATALPAAGSNELRLDSTYITPGYAYTGFNHLWSSESGSGSVTIFGFGIAYGRFVTDNVEIGTSFTLIYAGDDDSSVTIPGISPFVRLFQPTGANSGIFGAGVVGIHYLSPDEGDGITMLSPGVDLGLEFFPAASWSLRVGPNYRYVRESQGDATLTLHSLGFNWALAGYF
jgi:hypothetical protein